MFLSFYIIKRTTIRSYKSTAKLVLQLSILIQDNY